MIHDLAEPTVARCVERLSALRAKLPEATPGPDDLYIIHWGWLKRRIAEEAANCVLELVPGVREVYYLELSDDYAGRDVDILIIPERSINEEELRETVEAILEKLAAAAGLSLASYTRGARVFEVHTPDSIERPRYMVLLASRPG